MNLRLCDFCENTGFSLFDTAFCTVIRLRLYSDTGFCFLESESATWIYGCRFFFVYMAGFTTTEERISQRPLAVWKKCKELDLR